MRRLTIGRARREVILRVRFGAGALFPLGSKINILSGEKLLHFGH